MATEAVEVRDVRMEPFVRMEPGDARLAAEGLEVLAMANRAMVRDGDAEDDHHAAVLQDDADQAEQVAAYLRGWADGWDPR